MDSICLNPTGHLTSLCEGIRMLRSDTSPGTHRPGSSPNQLSTTSFYNYPNKRQMCCLQSLPVPMCRLTTHPLGFVFRIHPELSPPPGPPPWPTKTPSLDCIVVLQKYCLICLQQIYSQAAVLSLSHTVPSARLCPNPPQVFQAPGEELERRQCLL